MLPLKCVQFNVGVVGFEPNEMEQMCFQGK